MGLELKIDLYALDTEVVNQPALYHEHATKLADARKAETAAKTNMELVKAQTTNSVKTDWREWGLAQSPTVQTVDATVLESEDYQDAQRRYHAAQHEVRILVAAVDALEHKRRMIESAIDLLRMDYFAKPNVNGERSEVLADQQTSRTEDALGRRRRRKGATK